VPFAVTIFYRLYLVIFCDSIRRLSDQNNDKSSLDNFVLHACILYKNYRIKVPDVCESIILTTLEVKISRSWDTNR